MTCDRIKKIATEVEMETNPETYHCEVAYSNLTKASSMKKIELLKLATVSPLLSKILSQTC